jgi:hypothetical protein
MKAMNSSIAKPHSNLDMACAVESVVSRLPQTLGMEFRWKIRSMLEKSRSSIPNMTNKEIKILQADKGNCTVVLDEFKYKEKLNNLLGSTIYELLPKDPTAKVERRV